MSGRSIFMLPGYGDSGPEHWQSLWEAADARCRRVVQRDWLAPKLDDWLATLERELSACASAPVLVAHSLGCVLVAHWVKRTGRTVAGALLVAPADADVLEVVESFRPVPLIRLPFPTIVVASDDDVYASRERAETFARAWGSRFVGLSGVGHINSDSGLGDWPDGRALLDDLLRAAT